MRTLVYKRTHTGDPNFAGHFGNAGCMGRVRSWDFEAVIGVGGKGPGPSSEGLDYRVNWVGLGARKRPCPCGGHVVSFDHFRLDEADGPDFVALAPRLARRIYDDNVRVLVSDFDAHEQKEITRILKLAAHHPPSSPLTQRVVDAYCRSKHTHHRGCSCGGCGKRSRDSRRRIC